MHALLSKFSFLSLFFPSALPQRLLPPKRKFPHMTAQVKGYWARVLTPSSFESYNIITFLMNYIPFILTNTAL